MRRFARCQGSARSGWSAGRPSCGTTRAWTGSNPRSSPGCGHRRPSGRAHPSASWPSGPPAAWRPSWPSQADPAQPPPCQGRMWAAGTSSRCAGEWRPCLLAASVSPARWPSRARKGWPGQPSTRPNSMSLRGSSPREPSSRPTCRRSVPGLFLPARKWQNAPAAGCRRRRPKPGGRRRRRYRGSPTWQTGGGMCQATGATSSGS
mmetsp:Transcript_127771/g.367801  ORF Transcript_127771/g.367801 Transcript_127771/m.367801 type:complete len:205 (+) Transcript_127771:1395-2009(+)